MTLGCGHPGPGDSFEDALTVLHAATILMSHMGEVCARNDYQAGMAPATAGASDAIPYMHYAKFIDSRPPCQ